MRRHPTSSGAARRPRWLPVLLGVLLVAGCARAASSESAPATTQPVTVPPTVAPTTTTPTTTAPTTTAPTTTTPTTTAPTAPAPLLRAPTPEQPLDTMILGDSTAYEVGNAMVRANTDGLLATELLFKASTGLARPDFFDWDYYLRFVVDNNPPELMVLSLGANDGQDLHAPDGSIHLIHTDGWRAEYLRRVDEITRYIHDHGIVVYWIGQPLAASEGYSAAMNLIDGVYREVADRYDGVEFVDIWPALSAPDGGYQRTIEGPDGEPVDIRAEDDIHLTAAGGDLAARVVLDALRRGWGG